MAEASAVPVSSSSEVAEVPPLVQVRDLSVHFATSFRRERTRKDERGIPDIGNALLRAIVPRERAIVRAVDGVSFHIQPGETLGLVGESGCGKTTTGRALMRLLRIARGSIHIDGIRVDRARGRRLRALYRVAQMVFQDPYASLDPRLTAGHIVAEPLRALGVEKSRKRRAERVAVLLESCGLDPRIANRYPHELSGGQRQRLAIARALAPAPKLLIADEAVSALDVSVKAQIVNLLRAQQARLGLSMLFITHDLAVVRHVSQRTAVMYLGRIVEVAKAGQLYDEPLHPYTRALMSAVPIPDPVKERQRARVLLQGEVPSVAHPPSGCSFHPRCGEATERCRHDAPLLKIGRLDRPVACHVAHDEG